MANRKDFPDWMKNRQKYKESRTKRGQYCSKCDCDYPQQGSKCSTCGNRAYPLRDKKPGPKE